MQLSGGFGADAVTGQHQPLRFKILLKMLRTCWLRQFSDLIHQAFLVVRQGCDFRGLVEFFFVRIKPSARRLFQAWRPAVFAEYPRRLSGTPTDFGY